MNAPLFHVERRSRTAARLLAGAACALLAAGCGGSSSAAKGNVVSCRMPDADRPLCVEDEPYSDDMRLVAVSKCREAGGSFGTACPEKDMAGSCERINEAPGKQRQPWEYSRRSRMYYYQVPGAAAGPLDVAKLQSQCGQVGQGGTPGLWTDAKP